MSSAISKHTAVALTMGRVSNLGPWVSRWKSRSSGANNPPSRFAHFKNRVKNFHQIIPNVIKALLTFQKKTRSCFSFRDLGMEISILKCELECCKNKALWHFKRFFFSQKHFSKNLFFTWSAFFEARRQFTDVKICRNENSIDEIPPCTVSVLGGSKPLLVARL